MNQKSINVVILIEIQTLHQQMSYLGYQNIFRLPKIINSINTKGLTLRRICDDYMKER